MISDFLSIFVLLILLISFDFWTVKNVTGRLLVGLRWWNRIDDEGRSHWIFENRHNTTDANKDDSFKASDRLSDNSADSTIFWTALIIAPILWFILLLVTVFRLNVQWFVCIIEFIYIITDSSTDPSTDPTDDRLFSSGIEFFKPLRLYSVQIRRKFKISFNTICGKTNLL